MVAPPSATDRIVELDAMRGLAVIGIVWMNVFVFAMPDQAYYNPAAWGPGIGEPAPQDRLVWVASFVFVEDKFRTLFAILFGAAFLILSESNAEAGWRAHYARMAVLFVIGLAHALFLASNDILRIYALAGLALPFLAPLSARALYAVAIGLVAVQLGGGIVAFGGSILDFYTGRTGSDAALFVERMFGTNEPAIRGALEQGRETFGERVERRFEGMGGQLRSLLLAVPVNLAAMALGMGLWKSRLLAGEWRTFRLQRLAAICALVALPALFALASWVSQNGYPGALAGSAALVWSAPFDMALGLAYAALAMAFFTKEGAVTRTLATVGRLSLSNYLLTSVILAGIFASWGLGLFGNVSRSQAILLGAARGSSRAGPAGRRGSGGDGTRRHRERGGGCRGGSVGRWR